MGMSFSLLDEVCAVEMIYSLMMKMKQVLELTLCFELDVELVRNNQNEKIVQMPMVKCTKRCKSMKNYQTTIRSNRDLSEEMIRDTHVGIDICPLTIIF